MKPSPAQQPTQNKSANGNETKGMLGWTTVWPRGAFVAGTQAVE